MRDGGSEGKLEKQYLIEMFLGPTHSVFLTVRFSWVCIFNRPKIQIPGEVCIYVAEKAGYRAS